MRKYFSPIVGKAIQEKRPLTLQELQIEVPSIFSATAHESRSERFAPVSTIQVLDGLAEHGWQPFFAVQARTRDEGKKDFVKHMVRLRRETEINKFGSVNEIILTNANDGTSAFNLLSGTFRFVCSNGCVQSTDAKIRKVYHKGNNIMDDVIEGSYHVVEEFDEINRYQHEMSQIILTPQERQTFALTSYMVREGMPEDMDFSNLDYEPIQLLQDHNTEDRNNFSLLSTFNVAQENSMRGGMIGESVNPKTGKKRQTRRRPITNIAEGMRVNMALWDIAKAVVEKRGA